MDYDITNNADLSTFHIDGVIRIPYLDGIIIEARFHPAIGVLIRNAYNQCVRDGSSTTLDMAVQVTVTKGPHA